MRSLPEIHQQVLNPTPLNPVVPRPTRQKHLCLCAFCLPETCHTRKRKLRCNFRNVALQKLHCNIRPPCSAEAISTKSCAAANEHCNIEKAALQESGAFLPLACGFQAPRLGTHVSDLLNSARAKNSLSSVFETVLSETVFGPSPSNSSTDITEHNS